MPLSRKEFSHIDARSAADYLRRFIYLGKNGSMIAYKMG